MKKLSLIFITAILIAYSGVLLSQNENYENILKSLSTDDKEIGNLTISASTEVLRSENKVLFNQLIPADIEAIHASGPDSLAVADSIAKAAQGSKAPTVVDNWVTGGNNITEGFIGTTNASYPLKFKSMNQDAGFIQAPAPVNADDWGSTSIGVGSLSSSSSGRQNSAFGANSLNANSIGFYNTAIGSGALNKNTSGYQNTAVGYGALKVNLVGVSNTAIGVGALLLNTANHNTATGYQSLMSNSSGVKNSAFGTYSLQANTLGSHNIAVGYEAGRFLASGSLNSNPDSSIFLGAYTQSFSQNQKNEIVIGSNAIGAGSNTMTLGRNVTKYKFRNILYEFPSVQGSSGQALTNNGSGGLSWSYFLANLGTPTSTGNSNGGYISGSTLYFSYANQYAPGILSTTSQMIGGEKTFNDNTSINGKSLIFKGSTSGSVSLTAPTSVTTYPLILPSITGQNGQVLTLTNNTTGQLSWTNSSSVSWSLVGNSGTNSANFLGTTDSKPLIFKVGNSERMRIAETGNVGIGITNPSANLEVANRIKISGQGITTAADLVLTAVESTDNPTVSSGSTGVFSQNSSFSMFYGNPYSSNGRFVINRKSASSLDVNVNNPTALGVENLFMINSNGYIGIGKTIPTEKLHVGGKIRADVFGDGRRDTYVVTTDEEGVLNKSSILGLSSQFWSTQGNAGTLANLNFIGTTDGAPLVFKVTNEVMRIDDRGFVGVGTSSPSEKLHVNGKVAINDIPLSLRDEYVLTTGSQGIVSKRLVSEIGGSAKDAWLMSGNNGVDAQVHFIGSINASPVVFKTSNQEQLRINENGIVGIGTGENYPVNGEGEFDPNVLVEDVNRYRLFVEDGIRTRKLKIDLRRWADNVFDADYKLVSLNELENYIAINKHLPGIPTTEKAMSDGIELGEMNALLLEKIEELTIHAINLNNKNTELEKQNLDQKKLIEDLLRRVEHIENKVNK